jgi:hypothetical protein
MSTLMRRARIGALIVFGLSAGHDAAQAQVGLPPGGNPYIAQRQYQYNLQVGRAALANAMVNSNPAYAMPYRGTAAYNPYMAYGGSPYAGYGTNPYMPGVPGVSLDPTAGAGSNPYAPLGAAADPYLSNPYAPGSAYANPYSNPAAGPGFTLMGGADMLRAYGTVITKQEQARIMRQEYYRSKLDTQKQEFDLKMYIRNNTPDWNARQEKITKSVLRRIQTASNPAEIAEGRSLNFLLDDVDKNYNKATVAEIPLDENVLKQLNIKPAGLGNNSLGMLRDGGKLQWPAVLVKLLPAEVRSDIDAKAQVLAQNAANGKAPDLNAAADFQNQINKAREQLLKKTNDFDTTPYLDAKRFLSDLDNSRTAIERGNALAQVQYQKLLAKNEVRNVNELVNAMVKNGWRFAPALLSDEAAYRALHSALVAYDVALNQQLASADAN